MTAYVPKTIPIEPRLQLQNQMDTNKVDLEMYKFFIGSLKYFTITCLDICFAMSCISC